jgi:putative oxidoreductase
MNKLGSDLGILFLRVASGLMMIFPHGWSKLVNFGTKMNAFPDPLGIGSQASLTGAVFTEFFCQILIILGIKTRWASLPLLFTMLVAAFIVHGQDPWMRQEKAVLYAVVYLTLFITNGGKFSIKN